MCFAPCFGALGSFATVICVDNPVVTDTNSDTDFLFIFGYLVALGDSLLRLSTAWFVYLGGLAAPWCLLQYGGGQDQGHGRTGMHLLRHNL